MWVFLFEEKIVEKGENAGLPAFSPFPAMFCKGFSPRITKSQGCMRKS